MKTLKGRRILALALTLTMMLSMVLVFTVSGSADAQGNKYTLDVAQLSAFGVGNKDDGDYVKAGTNNYFTVFYSAKTKVEPNDKEFSDELKATRRIAWGAKTEIGDQILNAVKIKTEGSATVKLWWVGGDDGRNPAIFDATGKIVTQDKTDTVKNRLYISELEIPSSGIYYIGNLKGSNYFYQIEVTDSANGEKPGARADWASVAAPAITSASDNGTGNIVVTVDALVGHDGGDELLVHMYQGDKIVKTKGSVTEKSTHTLTFTPENSGSYSFKAELLREGASNKVSTNASADFKYVLVAPYIKSTTSLGGGSIEIKWDAVHEAESYKIYCDDVCIGTVDGNTLSYISDGLTVGQKYSYVVSAVRGNEEIKSEAKSTEASAEAKNEWGFTIYGPSTNTANNGYTGSINDDGKVTVYSEGGKGKIQLTSCDGIAFYYTAIPTEYNFTLRARITVDSWTLSNGQEGFGLLVTDRIGENGNQDNFWNNSYLAGSTKIEYKYDSDNDEIVNKDSENIELKKYGMYLGIGTVARTGVTKYNLEGFEAQDTETVRNYKTVVTTLDRTAADLGGIEGQTSYNIIGNATSEVPGTFDESFVITEYIMEIQKNNSGYYISYYDKDGKLISQHKNYDPYALNMLDENFVYAGFFASRNARATFSDVEFSTILASEDEPREYPPTTYITPTVNVNSGSVTTNGNYELIVDVNVAGFLTVKYKGEAIVEEKPLDIDGRYKTNIDLVNYDQNYIDIEFDPDPAQWLGDFTALSSTRTVYNTHTVMYNRGNYHRKTVYISPKVKPYTTTADGTRENPFDIFTALENAAPGQTLILMEGTYKPGAALMIQRSMKGTADQMIRLIGDPEAKTRPVIDFEGLYSGFTLGGDYWYLRGFDVTGSANKQKGLQVSGNYNVLDQINAYYNGNTGIQLSRLVGTDLMDDWPSYNLVLNCTSYCNFDAGFEDADGFAAKLTVGPGNVFDGCISYNNADDGWDLYAKVDTGSIGAVTIQNCIAYDNGHVPGHDKTGNGNGFKLGGDSLPGKHVIKNCIAFNNLAKGIDSNSCPDIIVENCISFNNASYNKETQKASGNNFAFYTNNANNTAFIANSIISFRTENPEIEDKRDHEGSQVDSDYINESTYYWNASGGYSANPYGVKITADMFVSLEWKGWTRNEDGSINLGGFLEINDKVPENVKNCKLGKTASKDIELVPDEKCTFGDAWFVLDNEAHWHFCSCGNKSDVAEHTFQWIHDKRPVGDQPGMKHKECEICGYKKAAVEVYPDTPSKPSVPDTPTVDTPDNEPEELGFFARIWQAILNFFRSLFGLDKAGYITNYHRFI